MKKLPIGIQAFQKIREDDDVYVDETGIAVDLIDCYQRNFRGSTTRPIPLSIKVPRDSLTPKKRSPRP
ncbi:MAG: hypothetical protein CSA22_04290 [Deltaproteobacteria bacterium]|nr:MAG: hypothetical protein CSA22_04290 [Deltaproteobacteria bacterium]